MATAVIYGSAMDHTKDAAEKIAEALGGVDCLNIADIDADKINSYDKLVCGTSTWGSGDLQDDWDAFDFSGLSLAGKTVAVFGMGDSEGYADTYCGGMRKLYDNLKEQGATMVGEISTDGYEAVDTDAVVDGKFVGLALDDDNQEDLTDDRIANWVELIKPNF